MKYIKTFNDYESLNEGWKENLVTGLLFLTGVQGFSQKSFLKYSSKNPDKAIHNLLSEGWSLDSVKIDTIWKTVQSEKPNTEVVTVKVQLDKDDYFASGAFNLNDNIEKDIDSILHNIADSGIITDIKIISSTDKQPLSGNLQNKLKSLGFNTNNEGLSEARAYSLQIFLNSRGINDSLISTKKLWEVGKSKIEQSSRYVTLLISYLKINQEVLPSLYKEDPEVKKTYFLSKENNFDNKNRSYKIKSGNIFIHRNGTIKEHNRGHEGCSTKCWYDQN